ncbi:MAG TPA: DUF4198 domain-containing protein [Burkholderiaceae bacterium]
MKHRPSSTVAALVLAAAAHGAYAHDTWFAPLPAGRDGGVALALGTGNQFPVQESGIDIKHLVYSGCRHEPGSAPIALQRTADAPTALNLRVRAERGLPLTCWAQTAAFDVELADDKIALYFKEIQAPPEARDAWAQMRARGVKWKERYTKHARIELNPGPGAAAPLNMALDVLLESPQRTPRRGEPMQFRVLRNGQPLADFAVELRGDRSALGIWRKTDAEGRVRLPAPLPGRWVLRGTDLRVSERDPDTWESRFVTLAFEILDDRPAAPQAGSSDRSNARSTNHTAATKAISTEPPTITVRR